MGTIGNILNNWYSKAAIKFSFFIASGMQSYFIFLLASGWRNLATVKLAELIR